MIIKSLLLIYLCLTSVITLVYCEAKDTGDSKQSATLDKDKKKLPKDPLYISDLDLENLYDQWEESDDVKLPEDELPPHKQPPRYGGGGDILSDEMLKDPEKLMRASKKGKTVMAFVTVANNPTKQETEMLTQRWQVGLTNNHMKCERFVVSDDRAIFVFEDGSQAFEAKEFLLDQPELKDYSIDNRSWHGKGYPTERPHGSKRADATREEL